MIMSMPDPATHEGARATSSASVAADILIIYGLAAYGGQHRSL
jgi:hypothetical protein